MALYVLIVLTVPVDSQPAGTVRTVSVRTVSVRTVLVRTVSERTVSVRSAPKGLNMMRKKRNKGIRRRHHEKALGLGSVLGLGLVSGLVPGLGSALGGSRTYGPTSMTGIFDPTWSIGEDFLCSVMRVKADSKEDRLLTSNTTMALQREKETGWRESERRRR